VEVVVLEGMTNGIIYATRWRLIISFYIFFVFYTKAIKYSNILFKRFVYTHEGAEKNNKKAMLSQVKTTRCRSCCFWFKVRRQHSLQVRVAKLRKPGFRAPNIAFTAAAGSEVRE